ncbi:MAG TPA: glycosyltransferase family 9 protein [Candidatus Solibacter sp.]
MPSISCEQLAREILEQCIAGAPPQRLPQALLEEPCAKALFGILVEGLSDRFEPALSDCYARLLSQVIPGADLARYQRVRVPRPVTGEVARVIVLSRVTLGADVAVTSVLIDAAKRRFPDAQIVFAGPRKNFEMFAADPRLSHAAIEYRRGSLAERLAVWKNLTALATGKDTVVIDADSRLTQLGLLPVGEEQRYHLFDSRSYGGANDAALPDLTAQWAEETFGVAGAKPYVAPVGRIIDLPKGYIAISLGVGENPAKRVADPFEPELLRYLATLAPLVIDKGAGGEEAARVERAAGGSATFWEGSFAGFAKIIAGASLYVGYDSAGQHVAAACGVPLISIFAGFPVPRMFDRWRPKGTVIRVDNPDPAEVLARVREATNTLK